MNRIPWYEKRGGFTMASILVGRFDSRHHPTASHPRASVAGVRRREKFGAQFGCHRAVLRG
jgi:hypothetical protein